MNSGYNEITNYDKKRNVKYPDITRIGDIMNVDDLTEATKGADVIYNLAAEHADNVTPVSLYYDINVEGAKNIVLAAERNGINKIIFTSSVAIYGLNVGIPVEDSPANPFNDYGKSKLQAEEIYKNWAEKDPQRSLVIIRPVVVFGERNRGNVYNLLSQIYHSRFMQIGSGNNIKSMAYVGNVAAFLRHCLNFGSGVHIYNYADKPDISTNQLLDVAYSAFGRQRPSLKIPYAVGLFGGYVFDIVSRLTGKKFQISSIRIKKFCANTKVDTQKLENTDFKRFYSIEDGLKRMIEYEF
jgi:nucleoside-diphosphate-sugar epimerase